jgi:nucleolar complex protein 3
VSKVRGKGYGKGKKKALDDVDKDFREADSGMDARERQRVQTQTLEAMFEGYFRILKQGKEEHEPLFVPTFAGLAKFSHLISVDFLGDLLKVLQGRLQSGALTLQMQSQVKPTVMTS